MNKDNKRILAGSIGLVGIAMTLFGAIMTSIIAPVEVTIWVLGLVLLFGSIVWWGGCDEC